jgi:NifB/MoaA-like Fe-S oxidoreductase
VDQLPTGLRRSLYIKDDDARLSFLTGNYITLTNLSERELQRICDLRVSPIHVSVHATDPLLRAKLLGKPDAKPILPLLRRLSSRHHHGLPIVCCRYQRRRHLAQHVGNAALYRREHVSVVPGV